MRNGSTLGCSGLIALAFLIAVGWIAILYVGIPLAILAGACSIYLFRKYPDDGGVGHITRDMRMWAAILAGGAAILGVTSVVGNIYSDQGPFAKRTASKGSEQQIIPEVFRGKWAAKGDCLNVNSALKVDNDDIDFLGGGSFVADQATTQGNRTVILRGSTIVVADTWKDSGYQSDSVKLSVSDDGQTLWMNDSAFSRCAD